MHTVTVLVFSVLAIVALAENDDCQGCQNDFAIVCSHVGNECKGASYEALMDAFKKLVCEINMPFELEKCYGNIVNLVKFVKSLFDEGKSYKYVCTALKMCIDPFYMCDDCQNHFASLWAKVDNGGPEANFTTKVLATHDVLKKECVTYPADEVRSCEETYLAVALLHEGNTSDKELCGIITMCEKK